MSTMASQITGIWLFARSFVRAHIKENIKALCCWHFWGETTGDLWIPLTKGQWHGKCFDFMMSSMIMHFGKIFVTDCTVCCQNDNISVSVHKSVLVLTLKSADPCQSKHMATVRLGSSLAAFIQPMGLVVTVFNVFGDNGEHVLDELVLKRIKWECRSKYHRSQELCAQFVLCCVLLC